MNTQRTSPLGLIAGNGQFPFLVAAEAKRLNRPVVAVGLKEETNAALAAQVDHFEWFPLGQIKKPLAFFQQAGVQEAIMAGQVKHTQLFRRLRLDTTAIRILATVRNKKTDTLLATIAEEFKKYHINLISSTSYLQHLLAPEGLLTKRKPTKEQEKDIQLGIETARAMGHLDVGQTVCVKDQSILAVEAMEGTDACILRAGKISQGGFVVAKASKPQQDFRFDVPVIGEKTVRTLKEAQAAVLVVEAGKTLFFDRTQFLHEANQAHLVVLGISA